MGQLRVVTGKGGVGKTTVALALAQALLVDGPVLVCEVEGRGCLAAALGVASGAPGAEVPVAEFPGLSLLSVSPEAALNEYLAKNARLGLAGRALDRLGLVDFATTIAPGLRDVLLLGKVYEAAKRPDAYAAVVLDAPPTGRIATFLGAPAALMEVAVAGPIHAQAGRIRRFLTGGQVAVHLVATPAQLPTTETRTAVDDLRERNLPLGPLVANRVVPEPPPGELSPDSPLTPVLADVVARRAAQAPYLDELAALGLPVLALPDVLERRPASAAALRTGLAALR